MSLAFGAVVEKVRRQKAEVCGAEVHSTDSEGVVVRETHSPDLIWHASDAPAKSARCRGAQSAKT